MEIWLNRNFDSFSFQSILWQWCISSLSPCCTSCSTWLSLASVSSRSFSRSLSQLSLLLLNIYWIATNLANYSIDQMKNKCKHQHITCCWNCVEKNIVLNRFFFSSSPPLSIFPLYTIYNTNAAAAAFTIIPWKFAPFSLVTNINYPIILLYVLSSIISILFLSM